MARTEAKAIDHPVRPQRSAGRPPWVVPFQGPQRNSSRNTRLADDAAAKAGDILGSSDRLEPIKRQFLSNGAEPIPIG